MTKNEIIELHNIVKSTMSEYNTKSKSEEALDKVFKILSVVCFAVVSWSISSIIESNAKNREQDIEISIGKQHHEKLEVLVNDNTKSIQELNQKVLTIKEN